MKHIVVYVHGKGGAPAEAEHYKSLFPDSAVIGFDYRAQTPWEAKEEFPPFFAALPLRAGNLTRIETASVHFSRCLRWMKRWSMRRI